ncbi:hypothetical protein [Thiomicrorhabdus sp.]|uniref:hypothetical protein n=1 Tax=Thiomicrorhabdus sp. TaxID=2039724 RepID=UPI0029C7403C|nr:hypothetical protein [Thiomicrorhabdus sp.]
MSSILLHITESMFVVFYEGNCKEFSQLEGCIDYLRQTCRSKEILLVVESANEQLLCETVPRLWPWEKKAFQQQYAGNNSEEEDMLNGDWQEHLSSCDGKQNGFKMHYSLSCLADSRMKKTLERLLSAGFSFRRVQSGFMEWFRSVSIWTRQSARTATGEWRLIQLKRETKIYQYLVCDSVLYQARSFRHRSGSESQLVEEGCQLVKGLLFEERFASPIQFKWFAIGFGEEEETRLMVPLQAAFKEVQEIDFASPNFLKTLPPEKIYHGWLDSLRGYGSQEGRYTNRWLSRSYWLKCSRRYLWSVNGLMAAAVMVIGLQTLSVWDELDATREWQRIQLETQRKQALVWRLSEAQREQLEKIADFSELKRHFTGRRIGLLWEEVFRLLSTAMVEADGLQVLNIKIKSAEKGRMNSPRPELFQVEVSGLIQQTSPTQVLKKLQHFAGVLQTSSRISEPVWLQAPWLAELDHHISLEKPGAKSPFQIRFWLLVGA